MQPRPENEPVVAVIFHLAGPDAGETLVEPVANRREIEVVAVAHDEAEIVNPDRLAGAGRLDFEGDLRHHPEAHVLEHRQDVGQRQHLAGLVDLEPQFVRPGLDRTIEVHPERLVGERLFDLADVEHRGLRIAALPVGARERFGVAPVETVAGLLAVLLDQRAVQLVAPASGCVAQPGFDVADFVAGNRTGLRCDREVQPAHRLVAEMRLPAGNFAVEGGRKDVSETAAEIGVVAVARHVDKGGDEPLERVMAHEQRDPLAFLEIDDAESEALERFGVGLEQLVAREMLQDVQQRLAAVSRRIEARARQHLVHLAPQQRNAARTRAVGNRSEQPDEQPFADRLPLAVEPFDDDGVERRRAVHRRTHARLGDEQWIGALEERRHLGRQRTALAQAVEDRHRILAQYAETRFRLQNDAGFSAAAPNTELAIADEGEMVVIEPLQERRGLFRGGFTEQGGTVGDLAERLLRPLAHRTPVLDGSADIGEHPRQIALDGGKRVVAGLLVDLNLHEGFGDALVRAVAARPQRLELSRRIAPDHECRMNHQMHHQVHPVQLHRHRVDEKRHVVVDDFDDRVRRPPALNVGFGIVGANLRLARLPGRRETHQRKGCAVQVLRLAIENVVFQDIGVEGADEGVGGLALVSGNLCGCECRRLFDLGFLQRVGIGCHCLAPVVPPAGRRRPTPRIARR